MLNPHEKSNLIKTFAKKDGDCGSSEVQVALLSGKIKKLSEHLQRFPKDEHSRLGLICMIGKRRAFLKYLKRTSLSEHESLVTKLRKYEYL